MMHVLNYVCAEAAAAHKVADFDLTATAAGSQTDESFYQYVLEGVIKRLKKLGYVCCCDSRAQL